MDSLRLRAIEITHLVESFESNQDSSFLDKLIALLEKLWAAIVKATKMLLTEVGRMEFFLKRIEQDAKANVGVEPGSKTINLSLDGQRLLLNGKIPEGSQAFIRELLETKRQFDIMGAHYPSIIINYGEKLLNLYKGSFVSEKDRLEAIIKLTESADFDVLNRSLFTKYYKDSRFRDGSVQIAPPLLGDRSIFIKSKLMSSNSSTIKGRAATSRQLGIIFTQSRNEYHELQERSMNTLYAKDILIIVDKLKDMLYSVKSYGAGQNELKMAEIGKSIASELKTMKMAARDPEDQSYFKESVKFASLYSSWVSMPMDAFVSHVTRTIHASISVCQKSIKTYR